MHASTGGCGTWTQPSVAAVSVRLWVAVKAVMVATTRFQPVTSNSIARTYNRWSTPVRMCSTPSRVYVPATSIRVGAASTTNEGLEGVSRATCVVPSRRSTRTSTSVIVAARPAMWIAAPVNPPARFTLQRSV